MFYSYFVELRIKGQLTTFISKTYRGLFDLIVDHRDNGEANGGLLSDFDDKVDAFFDNHIKPLAGEEDDFLTYEDYEKFLDRLRDKFVSIAPDYKLFSNEELYKEIVSRGLEEEVKVALPRNGFYSYYTPLYLEHKEQLAEHCDVNSRDELYEAYLYYEQNSEFTIASYGESFSEHVLLYLENEEALSRCSHIIEN